MHDFLKILGISFGAAGGLAILVFIIAFFGPLLIGGPGAHQGPLGAFIYAPVVFFLCSSLKSPDWPGWIGNCMSTKGLGAVKYS
ncbi:MAG: hypothetical protein O6944_00225 [Gammaproteobacteria bacterium]|nr:hypothetical protein [Gammaproteobacteria bacterium]